jgi:hypothetical protein
MDIILERSGKQEEGRISFIKNSVFHDAFFLKALGEQVIQPESYEMCTDSLHSAERSMRRRYVPICKWGS